MAYTQLTFFLFLLPVLGIYFLLPGVCRSSWLLLASYGYIFLLDVKSGFFVLACTVITYFAARLMELLRQPSALPAQTAGEIPPPNADKKDGAKPVLVLTLLAVFGLLLGLKYAGAAADSFTGLLNRFGADVQWSFPKLFLPVGLSYYTFAAAGYCVDVYQKKRPAEKRFDYYALFLAFFPNFTAGPIERSYNLLEQIHTIQNSRIWDYDRVARGAVTLLWGYFMKLFVADRAAIAVNEIFASFWSFGSVELVLGAVLFSIQIYCDFAGISCMALGTAKIMGFDLIDNFDAPYYALSIKDFWRRWHISLSSWFRDYLYIPLGGNRKGSARKYMNMMIVFLVCGIWHGANWTFLVWGAVHGVYQLVGGVTAKPRQRFYEKRGIRTDTGAFCAWRRLCTFCLTAFAWIFFRAPSVKQAFVYIYRMVTLPDIWNLMNGKLLELGLDEVEWLLLLCGVAVVFLVDYVRYKKKENAAQTLFRQQPAVRVLLVLALLIAVMVFGCYGGSYGENAFIYAEF